MTKVLLDTDKAALIGAISGATVTDAGTPASDDKVLIQDTSDLDNLKYVNIADLPGGGVDVLSNVATASIIGRTTAGLGDSEELTAAQTRTLINVADGATANSSNATLLARANHTGTQLASTISDFAATVRATVLTGLSTASSAAVVAGDSILVGIGKLQAQVTLKANLASPTFTGTVAGITATMVGLGNVDNTSNATERAAAATLESKRVKPRVSSSASGNITPTKVDFDRYIRTAQAAAITISNPTMDIGEVVAVQLTDNAVARAITFGTDYMALDGLPLPTTTTVSKIMSMVLEKVTATKVLVSYVNEA